MNEKEILVTGINMDSLICKVSLSLSCRAKVSYVYFCISIKMYYLMIYIKNSFVVHTTSIVIVRLNISIVSILASPLRVQMP